MDISAYCPQKIHQQSPRRDGRGDKVSSEGRHLGRGRRRREGGGETDQRWVWAVNGEKKIIVGNTTII